MTDDAAEYGRLIHRREHAACLNRASLPAPGWLEGTRVGVPASWPGQAPAIFLNTYTGVCEVAGTQGPIPPPNIWQNADLRPLGIPQSALGVQLTGFLIITSGNNSRCPDLAVSFSKPGALASPPVDVYVAQAVGLGPRAGALGGIRTNFTATVPTLGGMISWAWLRGDYPTWTTGTWPDKPMEDYPDGASYGLNISVQSYLMA